MKSLYSLPLLAGLLGALLMTGCTAELAGSSSNSNPSGNPAPANGDNPGGTPASDPAPTVSLSLDPSPVTGGNPWTMSWDSTNASSCTASGGWSGSKTPSGSESLNVPTQTTTYTLTCSGTGGSASDFVTVASSSSGPSPDTTAPTISNVSVSNITASSATVSWTTNENASTQVQYGTTNAYGSTVNGAANVTSHSINLAGLTAGTTYHYRVTSADAANNSASSNGATFTTAANSIPPPAPNPPPTVPNPAHLLFFDNFEYVAGRDDVNVVSVFQQHGWSWAKTQQTGVGNPRGYVHTVNQIPGYSGAFPGGASNRVLAMDILPTLPNRDGTNPTGSQTDFYLQYGDGTSSEAVPGNVWFQFWMYINYYGDQLSRFDRRNKFIYPCNGSYPCGGGNIKWLMSIEPGSYIPYWQELGVPSQGEVFLTTHVDRSVSTVSSPNTADGDQGKLGQTDLTHLGPNRWTLVKVNIDTSTQYGSYRAWIRPQGGGWIQVADFRHGVNGFSWIVNQVGGHRTFRMPTTLGSGTPEQPRWDAFIYMDDFAMASAEDGLPVY